MYVPLAPRTWVEYAGNRYMDLGVLFEDILDGLATLQMNENDNIELAQSPKCF